MNTWEPTAEDWAEYQAAQWMKACPFEGTTGWVLWSTLPPSMFTYMEGPPYMSWGMSDDAILGVVRFFDASGYPPEWWTRARWFRPTEVGGRWGDD